MTSNGFKKLLKSFHHEVPNTKIKDHSQTFIFRKVHGSLRSVSWTLIKGKSHSI